VTISTLRPGT